MRRYCFSRLKATPTSPVDQPTRSQTKNEKATFKFKHKNNSGMSLWYSITDCLINKERISILTFRLQILECLEKYIRQERPNVFPDNGNFLLILQFLHSDFIRNSKCQRSNTVHIQLMRHYYIPETNSLLKENLNCKHMRIFKAVPTTVLKGLTENYFRQCYQLRQRS
jgi:hypothetical protein